MVRSLADRTFQLRLSVENSERKESVAELARSKRERADILNTFQAVLPTDFFLTDCFTHDFKRAGGGTDDNPARHLKIMRSGGDYTMERFKETGVMILVERFDIEPFSDFSAK